MSEPERAAMVPVLQESAISQAVAAAISEARARATPVGVAVVDLGGHLRAWVLMDGASTIAFDVVLRKARTAAFTARPTGAMPAALASEIAAASPIFTNLAGGFPIVQEGHVVGAIAAGGGPAEDDCAIAQAGLAQFADAD